MDPGRRRIRETRERLGLTQAALAEAAGVSRQLVVAVEQGRNAPSVGAAIGIARALGTTVEDLFGTDSPSWRSLTEDAPADGTAVRAVAVGDRIVVAPLDGAPVGALWEGPDGVIEGGRVRLFPGAAADGALVLGCDPALGLLEALGAARGPRRVVGVPATTGVALDALAADRAHGALVHAREGDFPTPPLPVTRVHLARWRVGLAVPRARRGRGIAEVLARSSTVVQRQPSATSQHALEKAAADLGTPLPAGPVASGHLDAARRAAATGAPALTMEPASAAWGLELIPLETHRVELWIAEARRGDPAIAGLLELLTSPALRERLEAVGGYDLDEIGTQRRVT